MHDHASSIYDWCIYPQLLSTTWTVVSSTEEREQSRKAILSDCLSNLLLHDMYDVWSQYYIPVHVLLIILSVHGLHSLLWNVNQSVVIICVTDETCRFMIRVLRAVQMEIVGVWGIMSRQVGNCCFCGRAACCTETHGIICDLTRCHIPEVLISTVVAFCVNKRRSCIFDLGYVTHQ
jgi:hypothetical protein